MSNINAIAFVYNDSEVVVLAISESFLQTIDGSVDFIEVAGEELNCDWGYTYDCMLDTLDDCGYDDLTETLESVRTNLNLDDFAFCIIHSGKTKNIARFVRLINTIPSDDETIKQKIEILS